MIMHAESANLCGFDLQHTLTVGFIQWRYLHAQKTKTTYIAVSNSNFSKYIEAYWLSLLVVDIIKRVKVMP